MKLVPRLASPVGFGLALLFFLLPFVAVSCEAPGLGSAEISYTGVDLATGGDPSVNTTGDLTSEVGAPVPKSDNAPDPGGQVLAIITMALLVIGLGVGLAPVARTRTLGAAGIAVVGGALLIVTEAVVQSNLTSALTETVRQQAATNPADTPSIDLRTGIFDNLVQTRIGFWLSLVAVILVLLFNAGVLLWPRIRAASVAPPPPPPPPVAEPEAEPPSAVG